MDKDQLRELQIRRAVKISYAIKDIINENNRESERPFTPGWEDHSNILDGLVDNICELYKHPRKNAEILYFLNELVDSYDK